jgi:hypothetical protein
MPEGRPEVYPRFASLAVPANTPPSAPATLTLDLGLVTLHRVRLRIPSGHLGLTGFQLAKGPLVILPWGGLADWVIGNDEEIEAEVGLVITEPLTLKGYNQDTLYQHTFYIALFVSDFSPEQRRAPLGEVLVRVA